MEVKPRETILLVEDFDAQIKWYCDILGFKIIKKYVEDYHYCVLENAAKIKLAIALSFRYGSHTCNHVSTTVLLQFEDVQSFLECMQDSNGAIIGPAVHNKEDGFWFGSFADPEGNAHWVVDCNCP